MRRLLLPITLVLGLLAVVGLPAAALVLAERETVSSTTGPPGLAKGWHKNKDRDKGWDKGWHKDWHKGEGKALKRDLKREYQRDRSGLARRSADPASPRRWPGRSCDKTGGAWELGPPPWVSPPQQRG